MTLDTGTLISFVVALVLVLIINETEEGIPLILIGFISMAIAWNITSIFGVSFTGLDGFGKLIFLGYWITIAFAFLKAAATGYYNGVFNAKRSKHE